MQADAILAMQLQQLDRPGGRQARARNTSASKADIAGYERILADEQLILDLIRADLRELKDEVRQPAPERDLRRGAGRLRQGSR